MHQWNFRTLKQIRNEASKVIQRQIIISIIIE